MGVAAVLAAVGSATAAEAQASAEAGRGDAQAAVTATVAGPEERGPVLRELTELEARETADGLELQTSLRVSTPGSLFVEMDQGGAEVAAATSGTDGAHDVTLRFRVAGPPAAESRDAEVARETPRGDPPAGNRAWGDEPWAHRTDDHHQARVSVVHH